MPRACSHHETGYRIQETDEGADRGLPAERAHGEPGVHRQPEGERRRGAAQRARADHDHEGLCRLLWGEQVSASPAGEWVSGV